MPTASRPRITFDNFTEWPEKTAANGFRDNARFKISFDKAIRELESRGCGSLTIGLCTMALRSALESNSGAYTGEPCPNCLRIRMLKLGVCDKCYWDLTTGTYATNDRQRQADIGRAEP